MAAADLPQGWSAEKWKLLKTLLDDRSSNISTEITDRECSITLPAVSGMAGGHVEGPDQDKAEEAREKLLECVEEMVTMRLELDDGVADAFIGVNLVKADAWLDRILKGKKQHAVLFERDKALFINGTSDLTNIKVARLIRQSTKLDRIESEADQITFASTNWQRLVSSLEKDLQGPLCIRSDQSSPSTILVSGCSESVDVALAALQEHLKENLQGSKKMDLDAYIAKLIKKYHKDDIRKDLKGLDTRKVTTEFEKDCITLSGNADSVNEAEQHIRTNYLDKVIQRQRVIETAGVKVNKIDAQNIAKEVERSHNCTIHIGPISIIENAEDNQQREDHGRGYVNIEERTPERPVGSAARFMERLANYVLFPYSHQPSHGSPIEVVQGSVTDFQADVLVDPLAVLGTNELDKAGFVPSQFAKKGGIRLRQEYFTGRIPRTFGRHILQTGPGDLTNAKKIYHTPVGRHRDSTSDSMMYDCICLCLRQAKSDGMRSIAFPTLGCGGLKYDSNIVANCFNRAAQTVDGLKVYIVAHDPRLFHEFKQTCSQSKSSGHLYSSFPNLHSISSGGSTSIYVAQGSLVDFQADVLVNTIAKNTNQLHEAGVVAKLFAQKGGPALQQEYSRVGSPVVFGSDLTSTSPGNIRNTNMIYHTAIGKYRDHTSEQMMLDCIRLCLAQAQSDGMRTIAFPTLGCGHLHFSTDLVANCFRDAAQDFDGLTIYIVAYDQKLYSEFLKHFNAAPSAPAPGGRPRPPPVAPKPTWRRETGHLENTQQAWENVPYPARESPRQESRSGSHITVDIYAMSQQVIKDAGDELEAKLKRTSSSEESGSVTLQWPIISVLSGEPLAEIDRIRNSQPNLEIIINKAQSCVIIKGQNLDHVKNQIEHILELAEDKPVFIKITHGVTPYLKYLGDRSYRLPLYWTGNLQTGPKLPGVGTLPDYCVFLMPTSRIFAAVKKLFESSWEKDHIGHGADAAGLADLQFTDIRVQAIWRVQNTDLYRRYREKFAHICRGAVKDSFPIFSQLNGQQEIKTRALDIRMLEENLVTEMNEYYLFHGTKHCNVINITKQGVDNRLAHGNYYGAGNYFAECTTKADQYSDKKDGRLPLGKPMYQFVFRVVLGDIFVCPHRMTLRRPPCKQPDCPYADTCTVHGELHDSVMGKFRKDGTELLFREFITYHGEQNYPEFLVQYIRVQ